MKKRDVIEPLKRTPVRYCPLGSSLRGRFRKAAEGDGGMTAALQKFVKTFVN